MQDNGKIGYILRQYIAEHSADLTLAMTSSSDVGQEQKAAVENVSYVLENVLYELTDIMVRNLCHPLVQTAVKPENRPNE